MKRKLIVMFGIVCSMGLLACNSAENGVAEAGETKAESVAESVAPAGPINVKDYYSVAQTESGEMVYSFDTSVFDQERFDDKWIFDTIEVPLPLGSVREIQELGVDMGDSSTTHSKEDLYVNSSFWGEQMVAPGETQRIKAAWGFLPEDDYMDEYLYGEPILRNNSEADICCVDADIDSFIVDVYGDENAVKLASVLGIECDSEKAFNLDKIVERFGIPTFYWKISRTTELELYYFYGDYSLIFYFKGYGDDHDRLERMYYKSAKSLEESVEIEEADDYEPDKWVEYNKACEAYR